MEKYKCNECDFGQCTIVADKLPNKPFCKNPMYYHANFKLDKTMKKSEIQSELAKLEEDKKDMLNSIEELTAGIEVLSKNVESLKITISDVDEQILKLTDSEPSAAEKWVKSERGHVYLSDDIRGPVEQWAAAGHEAGQKHGAEVEREKIWPQMETVQKHGYDEGKREEAMRQRLKYGSFLKTVHECIKKISRSGSNLGVANILADAVVSLSVKNMESDHGGLSEKPTWVVDKKPEKKKTATITIYDDGSIGIDGDGDFKIKCPSVTFI